MGREYMTNKQFISSDESKIHLLCSALHLFGFGF